MRDILAEFEILPLLDELRVEMGQYKTVSFGSFMDSGNNHSTTTTSTTLGDGTSQCVSITIYTVRPRVTSKRSLSYN